MKILIDFSFFGTRCWPKISYFSVSIPIDAPTFVFILCTNKPIIEYGPQLFVCFVPDLTRFSFKHLFTHCMNDKCALHWGQTYCLNAICNITNAIIIWPKACITKSGESHFFEVFIRLFCGQSLA